MEKYTPRPGASILRNPELHTLTIKTPNPKTPILILRSSIKFLRLNLKKYFFLRIHQIVLNHTSPMALHAFCYALENLGFRV